jgi:glutathione S-transferase
VVIALHEKQLKYKSHIVELSRFEQYEPLFMKLNPKSQVPVLKDGVKIIPDSERILEYLEDNFSNGDTPRLMPKKGNEQFTKVQRLRELLDSVNITALTTGSAKYPEVTVNMKLPSAMRNRLKDLKEKQVSVLEQYRQKYPEFEEYYHLKSAELQSTKQSQNELQTLREHLDGLEAIMDDLERELASNTGDRADWWLCSPQFSLADINLAVLLHRLDILGLSTRYWGNGRRRLIAKYHERLITRPSFHAACLELPSGIKLKLAAATLYDRGPLLIAAIVTLAALTIGVAAYRKSK